MNIAILGLGVVGRGVYDLLIDLHKDITVKYVLELDPNKLVGVTANNEASFDEILNDKDIDIIVELIGGKGIAYEFIKQALSHKKHVVTANKAVVSAYFEELHTLAKANNVSLRYEASVGGGIIVLNPLEKLVKVNPIHEISGIINGSTNFILSKIFLEEMSYEDAYNLALENGYIEAAKSDDMDGLDLMRKINILSMMSYHQLIDEKDINLVPLSMITKNMIQTVKKMGKTIKYVAYSSLKDGDITISLEPVIMGLTESLGSINYEQNAITIKGMYHQFQTFVGLGAGRYPTASAVVYDILNVANGIPFSPSASQLGYTVNTNPVLSTYLVETKDGFTERKNASLRDLLDDQEVISFAGLEY